jgi:hypothetical protein
MNLIEDEKKEAFLLWDKSFNISNILDSLKKLNQFKSLSKK